MSAIPISPAHARRTIVNPPTIASSVCRAASLRSAGLAEPVPRNS
jgi:hypothetical protein